MKENIFGETLIPFFYGDQPNIIYIPARNTNVFSQTLNTVHTIFCGIKPVYTQPRGCITQRVYIIMLGQSGKVR